MAFRIIWCDQCNKEVGRVQKTGKTIGQIEEQANRIKRVHWGRVHPFGQGAIPTI